MVTKGKIEKIKKGPPIGWARQKQGTRGRWWGRWSGWWSPERL